MAKNRRICEKQYRARKGDLHFSKIMLSSPLQVVHITNPEETYFLGVQHGDELHISPQVFDAFLLYRYRPEFEELEKNTEFVLFLHRIVEFEARGCAVPVPDLLPEFQHWLTRVLHAIVTSSLFYVVPVEE